MINPIYKKKKEIEQLESSIKNLYKQNKYTQCIKECEKLASVFLQKSEIVYLYLGKSYMNLGNYEKSKQSFNFCLTINQFNMECYINLGTINAQLNEYEEALDNFNKYEQLIENDKESKEYTKRKVSLLFNLSNTYFMSRDYEKAEEYIVSLLEIEQENKSAKLLLGDIFYMREEYEKALEMYFQVLEKDKNGISACYKIGMANWKLEKFTDAIGNFELCIAINKRFIDAYAAIGMILFRHLQKYDEALFNFNEFLQYNQKDLQLNVQIYIEMGEIYETLFKSKDAIEQYKKAFDLNKNNTIPLEKIAVILFEKRQDYQGASEYYEKIVRIKPSCKNSFIRLGKCHFELKKYDKCIEVYKNELLLDPYNSETFQAIALCYQELNNYKEADIYFQLSLQINPFDSTVKEQYAKLRVLLLTSSQQQKQ